MMGILYEDFCIYLLVSMFTGGCFQTRQVCGNVHTPIFHSIVTCFILHVATVNVDSPDLTRKFIGTIVEITHNKYNTHFRV
jgi:hypothetical protein